MVGHRPTLYIQAALASSPFEDLGLRGLGGSPSRCSASRQTPRQGRLTLEAASSDFEGTQEIEVEALDLLDDPEEDEEEETDKKETEKDKDEKVERAADSPAEIAAVVRQDRRRGRRRRRATRTIPPAGRETGKPALGRLSRDDLGYPLILLEEAAARCGERGGRVDGQAFDPLALKAKLTCAGALLERGRRFAVARRAGEDRPAGDPPDRPRRLRRRPAQGRRRPQPAQVLPRPQLRRPRATASRLRAGKPWNTTPTRTPQADRVRPPVFR